MWDFLLHREIAEGVAVLAALGGQGVEIAGGGQFHGLQIELGAGAADDDGEVIGAGQAAVPRRQDLLLGGRPSAGPFVSTEGVAW